MNPNQSNPYSAPNSGFGGGMPGNVDLKKVEAIIKDAGQFWLAILMCIFCSALGSIIIGPWYLIRLIQWNSIAKAQPMLLAPNPPVGSVAQRFQSAKVRLIIGLVFGGAMLVLALAWIAVMVVAGPQPPR